MMIGGFLCLNKVLVICSTAFSESKGIITDMSRKVGCEMRWYLFECEIGIEPSICKIFLDVLYMY